MVQAIGRGGFVVVVAKVVAKVVVGMPLQPISSVPFGQSLFWSQNILAVIFRLGVPGHSYKYSAVQHVRLLEC